MHASFSLASSTFSFGGRSSTKASLSLLQLSFFEGSLTKAWALNLQVSCSLACFHFGFPRHVGVQNAN